MEKSGLWTELASDWVILDTELMPWSAKAQELLQQQYAPVAAAGTAALRAAHAALQAAKARCPDVEGVLQEVASRQADVRRTYERP